MASSDSEKYLTEDLLMNIFVRVDVKTIIRCTCVCKTWHHIIIDNDSLVKHHLTYQKTYSNTNKYVLHYNSKGCKLLTDCDPDLFDSTKHSKLYYTLKLFEKYTDTCDGYHRLKIHGMCDGLLCFSVRVDVYKYFISHKYYRIGDNLHLWNPICRKAKKLPQLKISDKRFIQNGGVSFGYYGDDYKVIVISSSFSFGHEYIVSVYSLNSNCWNIIHTNCYYEEKILDFCILHPTKFIDGIAYMITATRRTSKSIPPLIVCFDLKDETIQQLKCPKEFVAYGSCYTTEAYGDTIAVLGCSIGHSNSRHLAMWTLLRDKVSSKLRWGKKLVIKLPEVGYSSNLPVGFLHDGKYVISRYSISTTPRLEQTTFLLCDLKSRKVTEYRSQNGTDSHGSIIIPNCVESLLLLNEDSIDPFVHTDMESCSSILFSMQKDILHPTKSTGTESERVSRGKKRARG